jgi:anti-sigma-K factor RskA
MTQPIDGTTPTDPNPTEPNPTDLMAGYVLNNLSPEETARFRQALANNPALAKELKAFEEAFALLPYGSPILEPAARLKGNILIAASRLSAQAPLEESVLEKPVLEKPVLKEPISAEPALKAAQPSNVVPIASARQRNWQRWIPAISTAAVAVAALGLNQIRSNQQFQQTAALQQQIEATNSELTRLRSELRASQEMTALLSDPNIKMYSLAAEETGNETNVLPATARVLAKPGEREVTLVAQNLPPLPEDKIYRFWSVTQASPTPMYCGQFRQDSSGTAQWAATDTTCMESPLQMMITLDSPNDPTTLPGPTVMESIS